MVEEMLRAARSARAEACDVLEDVLSRDLLSADWSARVAAARQLVASDEAVRLLVQAA